MKNTHWIIFASLTLALTGNAYASRVEVLLGEVFVPDVGYEDKNNIEITVDGYLPNSCYQIADTQYSYGPTPYTLIIHQFAGSYVVVPGIDASDGTSQVHHHGTSKTGCYMLSSLEMQSVSSNKSLSFQNNPYRKVGIIYDPLHIKT